MKSFVTAGVLLLAAMGGVACTCVHAAPEPSIVPPKDTYELGFKFFAPERLELTENGKKVTYWYVRYTVTNNTDANVIFAPVFELITDTGQAVKSYKNVDRSVYEHIKKLYKSELMENPFQVPGPLLPGIDNAKDGVMIFTGVGEDARVFTFYVTGLANEVRLMDNPKDPKGADKITLSKALEIVYNMPGRQIGVDPKPEYKGKNWVMK